MSPPGGRGDCGSRDFPGAGSRVAAAFNSYLFSIGSLLLLIPLCFIHRWYYCLLRRKALAPTHERYFAVV